MDISFQRLLRWFNLHGVSQSFRELVYVDHRDYGWAEWVSAAPCADHASLRRFYHRQGGLLAALHVLQANDFHAENLVAAGDQPVLVDLESVVTPTLPVEDSSVSAAERRAAEITLGSVLKVGLLPFRTWDIGGRSIDISGLGSQPGQRMPFGVPILEGMGTDTMHVRLDRLPMHTPNHRPVAEGEPLRLLDYAEDITAGFTEAYGVLYSHRDELLADGGPLQAFADVRVRVIARGTILYATIRQTGFHPALLADALRRDEHFDALWRTVPNRTVLSRLIPSEQRDLWNNDIPVFTAHCSSTELLDSTGNVVSGVELRPGMERVRDAVADLGNVDRDRQLWLIRGSLAATVIDAMPVMDVPRHETHEKTQPPHPSRLIAAAAAVGDHLARIAVDVDDCAQWLGVNSNRGQNWSLGPVGPDLFHGQSGIALFLAELGVATGEYRYTALAHRALATAIAQLSRGALGAGGMAGLPGATWVLCHLSRLWNDERLLALAEAQAERLEPLIDKDDEYDVVAGAAGSILALRSLHRLRPGGCAARLIVRCAEHLLEKASPFPPGVGWIPQSISGADLATVPLAGLAHGQAGFAWALLEAAALSGDQRYERIAQEAVAYERTLFEPTTGNWRDVRSVVQSPVSVVAWCHGAAGIGMARACSLAHVDDATMREEVEIALATTVRDGFGSSHCQCHGDLGNLELLLHAGSALHQQKWQKRAGRLAHGVLDSISERSWICGVALGTETPGLMVGLAGIGYGLLRMATPERVPAVLTLFPGHD